MTKDPVSACDILLKTLRETITLLREQARKEHDHWANVATRPWRDALVLRTTSAANMIERWLNIATPVFADLMNPDREKQAHNAAIAAAAQLIEAEAERARGLRDKAKARFAKRDILAAVGYQGDPDAECIEAEAMVSMAVDLAAHVRTLTRP